MTDPTDVKTQHRLKQWIAYEVEYHQIKAHTVEAKATAIDDFHIQNGQLPPFQYATIATKYLKRLMRQNTPS